MLIGFANRFFTEWPSPPPSPRHDLRYTTDPREIADADAVVFHLASPGHRPTFDRRSGQLWVGWCQESRVMCPPLRDDDLLAHFDLTMTYERRSDVWCPYFGSDHLARFEQASVRQIDRGRSPVAWLCRNGQDRAGRVAFAAELMDHVAVDSFGDVLRTRPERVGVGDARLELYGRYKFTLAFENSYAPDYVTEKLFEPLLAGSVPVYRGTETVADLAPHPNCYIDAADFSSPGELGRYLNHLDRDDRAYEALHAWRQEGPSVPFRSLAEPLDHPVWRLADLVAARTTVPRLEGPKAGGRDG